MEKFARPKIVVSECLGFSACRYNGQKLSNDFVSKLLQFADMKTVCPEVAIGLGTPRDSIRIVVDEEGKNELFQPKTERFLTNEMNHFSQTFLGPLDDVDGFLMKASSPTCGVKGIPIYKNDSKTIEKREGFFVEKIKEFFTNTPLEDEGRLHNYHIRENYLTRIFTLAKFRTLERSIKSLVQFQSENKYLFMNLHPKYTTELGRITANHDRADIHDVFDKYKAILQLLLQEKIKKKRTVNSLQHIFGYFSKDLVKAEKDHFLELVEEFRSGKEYLFTINQLLWSWVLRYENSYLKQQTFFNPYPKELMEGVNISLRVS